VEQVLRAHRDRAFSLIKENTAQARDGIEMLVKGRLEMILTAARPNGSAPTPEQVEAVYREILDLSFVTFALGYTMAHTNKE
jgi:hypothetical protein